MATRAIADGQDYDRLWKPSSIDAIRQLQSSLHSDAAAKVEELRSLIGDRFRDLLQTTDSIREMKLEFDSACKSVTDLHALFDNIADVISAAHQSASEKNSYEEEARDRQQRTQKDHTTVLFTAENVWKEMDTGRLQLSVDLYQQGIQAFARLDHANAPIWIYHSELLQDLPRQIKQACYDRLVNANDLLRDEDALRAIAAVDGLDWKDALGCFLHCRFQSIQQLIACNDPDGRLAYTIRLTLSECYNWFGEPQKISALGAIIVQAQVSDWFQDSIGRLLSDSFPALVLSYQGEQLANVRDQILKVLFQDTTNSWPVAVQYCLGFDIGHLWESMFYGPLENALLQKAQSMFGNIPNQFGEYLQELEPSISKLCDNDEISSAVRCRRNSTFWRQVMEMNDNSTWDPYLVLIESTGERFTAELRSLSQTSHSILDSSTAKALDMVALIDLLSGAVPNRLEQSCTDALVQVAEKVDNLVSQSTNPNRSVLYARMLRRFFTSVVHVKSLLKAEKFNLIETRFQSVSLKAYHLWTETTAKSIMATLTDRISETFTIWMQLEPERFISTATWALVNDVHVPRNASPFAMRFLYDLNRQIQTLHCVEFDGLINAYICGEICNEVITIVNARLDSIKLLPHFGKLQFLFDILFVFAQISVPSHVLSSYGMSSEYSENVAAAIRELRSMIDPVALATLDLPLRESVRLQSSMCAVMFGSIFQSLPISSTKLPAQSSNRANLLPLISRDAPRLPLLPVNLYANRELKRPDLNEDLQDSEPVTIEASLSPTTPDSRSGLSSSAVTTSATKWLADASFGLSSATSGLSSMFKHYSKQQQQQQQQQQHQQQQQQQ